MGLKCWTKGEHQISKLQLQLVYVHCTRYEIPSVLWRQSMPIAITHFSHFPRQTWRQLPKSHIAACITSYLCNNIVLREYSNMLKQYNMLQQYKHCYSMLQHLQVCSVAALQNWCKNFNHLVHASSGLSGREQALWAKQMHVMADWGVMRPICCVTSVPSPSHLIKICMPDRNGYLAKSRCCLIILSAVPYQGSEFLFKFQSNLFQLTCFGTLHAQLLQSLVVSRTFWTSF